MNGRILTNHVNHLDNFKKLEENVITAENLNTSFQDNAGATLHEKDRKKLGTIEEEAQAKKDNDSSGEDMSSITSDTESDNDGSLNDSTEEEVEFFPAKEASNFEQFHRTQTHIHPPVTSKDIVSLPNNDPRNSNDVVNGENTEANIDEGNQNTEVPNKLPLKLSPLLASGHNNGGKLRDQVDGSSLSIPTTSNSYGEQSTSGSSDIIIAPAHNPPDLIKGNLNSSGTVSDDSDLRDHARIFAELQKIVQDDELHDGHGQSNDGDGLSNEGDSQRSQVRKLESEVKIVGSNDGRFNSQGISEGGEHNNGANVQIDIIKNGFQTSTQHDDDSTMRSHLDNSGTKMDTGTSIDGHSKGETYQKNDDKNTDGAITCHDDGRNLDNGTHCGESSHSTTLHGPADIINPRGEVVNNNQHDTKSNDGTFDGSDFSRKNDILQQPPTDKKPEVTLIPKTTLNSQHEILNSSTTNFQATPAQPANFANQGHSGLENLERKLSNLQISNTEQTEEIRRLKALNQSLKTKFEKLEQSSSHHQNIEERILQRNEELEKHLLGMLKSQEIIFEMKENLKAASADNVKLTNDYKEAVKALEAVDKLVGIFSTVLQFVIIFWIDSG